VRHRPRLRLRGRPRPYHVRLRCSALVGEAGTTMSGRRWSLVTGGMLQEDPSGEWMLAREVEAEQLKKVEKVEKTERHAEDRKLDAYDAVLALLAEPGEVDGEPRT
jgi:hypothetical protein